MERIRLQDEVTRQNEGNEEKYEGEPQRLADSMRVARAEGRLVNCDDDWEERSILDRFNFARLIEHSLATPFASEVPRTS
jgi:hypothetical protein